MCDVLIVEDDEGSARALDARLRIDAAESGINLKCTFVKTLLECRDMGRHHDAIVLDLDLPDSPFPSTLAALPELASVLPPVLVVTSYDTFANVAKRCIADSGAMDFVDRATASGIRHSLLNKIMFGIWRRRHIRKAISDAPSQ